MTNCAQSELNIHVGRPQLVSLGSRTKTRSPCRSFCLLQTQSDWPAKGCHG
jgi:hypothetical protein